MEPVHWLMMAQCIRERSEVERLFYTPIAKDILWQV